jgi:hypothetical protein
MFTRNVSMSRIFMAGVQRGDGQRAVPFGLPGLCPLIYTERGAAARTLVKGVGPAALLVCREDLHPQVVDQVLKAATAIHGKGSLMDPPGKYPSPDGLDLPVHDTADTYLKWGEPFLSRLLPYCLRHRSISRVQDMVRSPSGRPGSWGVLRATHLARAWPRMVQRRRLSNMLAAL